MEQETRLLLLQFGLFLSYLSPCEPKKLTGFEFPVYTTHMCPRNETEWSQRSSSINCTKSNSYICIPNENLTELLEFCYIYETTWIPKGACLYLIKRYSKVDTHKCNKFEYGCPNITYKATELINYPSCTSIGNGCFLAESTCKRATTTTKTTTTTSTTTTNPSLQETTKYNYPREIDVVWIVTLFGVFNMMCVSFCWILYRCKGKPPNRNTNYDKEGNDVNTPLMEKDVNTLVMEKDVNTLVMENDVNTPVMENDVNTLVMENNQRDEIKDIHAESPCEKLLFAQWQEEDTCFITTKAYEQVEKKIKSHNVVVVTGHSGSGKSAIVQHIALQYRNQGWIVKSVTRPDEIMKACTISKIHLNNKILYVMNDPIGKTIFDEFSYHSWKGNKETFNSVLKTVKLLLSCRKNVFYNRKQDIFETEVAVVDIDNPQCMLTNEEKRQILNKHIPDNMLSERGISEILKIVTYFPLLCKMYGSNKMNLDENEAIRFFTQPFDMLKNEIKKLRQSDKEIYCALVLLVFFDNKLRIDELLKKESIFQHTLKLCGMLVDTSPYSIGDNLEVLNGFLVKKNSDTYQFCHNFAMDVTCFVIGTDYPEDIINNADIGFLQRGVRLKTIFDQNDSFMIYINDRYIDNLVNRLFVEIFEERFLEVVLNPCLKDERIIESFKKKIDQHPEKIQLLLKMKTPKVENLDLTKTSDKNLLERVAFMRLEKEISPLFVLILFCHTDISLYCLQTLSKAQANLKESKIFSAVCCNGSESLFKMFSNESVKASLKEMWEGYFPIHIVSFFHNFEILKELISLGANVNMLTQSEKKWSPLMVAATTDYEENSDKYSHSNISREDETVLLLLKNGAKINVCDENGFNAIHLACQNGHERIVQRLIDRFGTDINCSTTGGATPLFLACEHDQYNTVKRLLVNNADVNVCTKDRESPLFIACENGHDRIVQQLLENEANITSNERSRDCHVLLSCQKEYKAISQPLPTKCATINVCNHRGASPLYIACKYNRNSTVELLLSNGADLNLCEKDGTSPLYIACKNGNESLVHVLLDNGAHINLCTEDKTSPLYIASNAGNDNIVCILIDHEAKVNLCRTDGASPLYAACQNNHYSTVKILLCKDANINLCKNDGTSPLFVACLFEYEILVDRLLNDGADVNLCGEDGTSPLFIACQKENEIIVQKLLDKEADSNLCRKDKTSPLSVVCQNGNESLVKCLLNKGADINLCTENGASPLFFACQNGHYGIVHALLNKVADINQCNKDGTSPLHIACQYDRNSTVEILLSTGAKTNLCRKDGLSPLHVACFNGNESLVKSLLKNGADVISRTKEGHSSLDIACLKGFDKIVQLLDDKSKERFYNGHEK